MTLDSKMPTDQTSHPPYGLLMLDDNLAITAVDGRFLQLFACQNENLTGVNLEQLFNDNDRKAVTDFHRKISSYQSGFIELAIELQIKSSRYYVLMRLSRQQNQWLAWVENLHGHSAGFIGELFSNQDRYQSVVRNSGDGIVLLNANNELIEFNKSFFDIVSIQNAQGILLNEAALIGKDLFTLVDDEFLGVKDVIALAHSKKRAQLNYRVEFKKYSLSLDISPIFQPAIGYIGCGIVMHDQTAQSRLQKRAQELADNEIKLVKEQEAERLELEFQLRQAQKMEAIGQLTGGIAHDFNNILTSVLGNAELALEIANQSDNPLLQKYLTNLLRSGQRARDLIGQMLVFSRGQRGTFEPLSLTQVVHDVVKLMELSLPSCVQIHTRIDDQISLVKHDALQIEQVLMNLCMNAHDAMEGAGNIQIRLSRQQAVNEVCSACSHRFSGDFVVLTITDNGTGIEPDIMQRIFEPFYTTKEVGKGSGMGLSMAHGIVHEHHGHIQVESEQGRGASFNILLPVIEQTSVATPDPFIKASHSPNIQQLTGSVLLVDDEPLVTEFMQDFMHSRGLKVTATTSSLEALQLFNNNADFFNLIITDQTMPNMTGMQLAEQLLQIKPDIPIILYTGHSEKLSEQQVSSQGIQGYLKKPVDTKLLIETIQQLLTDKD